MRKKDWFRPKSYIHIGLPLTYSDRSWVSKYVKNETKIAQHAFLPFIYRKVIKRKFRRTVNKDGSRSKNRVKGSKRRDIYYAAHLDSQIYSYYAKLLMKRYEAMLKNLMIEDCVTAYRRIPVVSSSNKSRNKCNIDFAKEVFDFISSSNYQKLIAISFDIKSFFDSLNHKKLKKAWYNLLGSNNHLNDDHYNLFKSLTEFSYVNENQLFNEFKDEIIVETKSGKRTKKRIKRKKFLLSSGAIAFCKKNQFKSRVRDRGLVKESKYINDSFPKERVKRKKGIPQGTPLSAVLANIYMLKFDKTINKEVRKVGGLYRRYSDDMVIVCEEKDAKKLKELVQKEIKKSLLDIQDKKTSYFRFEKNNDHYTCKEWISETKTWYSNTNFEYLGFEFDGKRTLLKSASISKYYRKLKRNVRRSAFFAEHGKNDDDHIYRKKLYKRFSHLGAGRRLIYKRSPKQSDEWIKSHKYDWGNFITYVKLAADIMDEPAILNQLQNHWKLLNEEINKLEPVSEK